MKFYKQLIFILIVFFKTETLLSEDNLFNVNNIRLEKNNKDTNNELANKAIRKGFNQLIYRILLEADSQKLSNLNFSSIEQLVTYYQISNSFDEEKKEEFLSFSVTFDKDKIHDLFYNKGISYSEILDKELYILPILIRNNEIFIFNNNFFYDNWNKFYKDDLIEFILPLENIELIRNIINNKNSLINLNLRELFKEYQSKNLAIVLIEDNKVGKEKIFIKALIQGKKISKSLNFKKENLKTNQFYKKTIVDLKKELIDLVKSNNLIDIRTPSFLNVKLDLNEKSNLVVLNSKIKNIDLIEDVFVQDFNKDYVNIKIKYLGKLEKIINQLKKENINLQSINDQWVIKTL
tara:strand:- start:2628 stop:3674 length:1047 start_codon:yes stop_codon:yes gene_type:complete